MERVRNSDNDDLRRRAAELFGVDSESTEELEARFDEIRAIIAQGPEAFEAWVLEGDEHYQELKREIEDYLILEDAKSELQVLINTNPNVAGAVETLRGLAKKPGVLRAVLYRIDDEETIADPVLRESIAAWQRGELVDLEMPENHDIP